MLDLQAISENQGWAISVVGITTVFTTLIVLSLLISQLHKVLALWERRRQIGRALFGNKDNKGKKEETRLSWPAQEAANSFDLLTARAGERLTSLDQLLELAEKRGVVVDQKTLEELTACGRLVQDENGRFIWQCKL
jgi:hypothetical protein